ncbi:sulfotransferase domain-containing protein [Porticoccaceae bacterium]|nr:sulfotransferase domain-containing protein [Porticoccaceae bacterium]
MLKSDTLPDVLVIGGAKCGTSSFSSMLQAHPEISLGLEKEPEILSKWFNKVHERYKTHFRNDKTKIKVDASTSYAKMPFYGNVAQRAYDLNPDLKIIFLYRDPIKRLCSHLNYDSWRNRIGEFNDDILWTNKKYINLSSYYYQLSSWLELFEDDRFLIINFDSLISCPQKTINAAYDFLGIDRREVNLVESNKTSNLIDIRIIKLIHSSSFLTGLMNQSPRWIKNCIRILLPKANSNKILLQPEILAKLKQEIGPDYDRFKNLSKRLKFV